MTAAVTGLSTFGVFKTQNAANRPKIALQAILPEHRIQGRQYPADDQRADGKTTRSLEHARLHDQPLVLYPSPVLDEIDDRHTDDTEDENKAHPIHEGDLINALVLIVRRIEAERRQPIEIHPHRQEFQQTGQKK